MTTESRHEDQPAIGAEIAPLRNLVAEVTGDLNAGERLIAVSWGRSGGKILAITHRWAAAGLAVIAAGFLFGQRWWLWAAVAVIAVAGQVMVVRLARIPGYVVLLTDRRLVLMRTSGSSPPRSREAPASVPRGDVSVTSGHGFFGTMAFRTLTTPVTAAPLRLSFDGQYVPAATAIYLSLTGGEALTSLRLPPPEGPALADSRTRSILRRHRYGAWLVLLAGAAIFTLLALFGNRPESTTTDWVILAAWVAMIGFLAAGVFCQVRVAHWRRILARCQWQEISYRYCEREEEEYSTGPGASQAWVPNLVAQSVTDPGKSMVVSLSPAALRWRWWRLRIWRQAPTGVAWLAGDSRHGVIVAPPGPGWFFPAKCISGLLQ